MEQVSQASYTPTTIKTVDQAVFDWFDKTVNARVPVEESGSSVLKKVPVFFSTGERWAVGRTRQTFRDENGVLILPIIAVRRTGIDPDPTRMALGCQTDFIQVAVEVDPKTNDIRNLEPAKAPSLRRDYPPVFDVFTIPFPDRVVANYQLVVQTQYIGQMNDILQKMWKSLDIQKSFVAPFVNDGRQPPRRNQYGSANPYQDPEPLKSPYVVGFFEDTRASADNFEEFTDTERIIKWTTSLTVPAALQRTGEGEQPALQVQRTAYRVIMKTEIVRQASTQEELDAIFGSKG